MKSLHVRFLALFLTLLGGGIFAYKAFLLQFPLSPNLKSDVWIVESKVSFHTRGKPTKVTLQLPSDSNQFLVMEENFVSRDFGLTTKSVDGTRQALWSIRKSTGRKTLYYRAVVRRRASKLFGFRDGKPEIQKSALKGAELEAAKAFLTEIREQAADASSFVENLIEQVNEESGNDELRLLLGKKPSSAQRVKLILELLHLARFSARPSNGILLQKESANAKIEKRIEVYIDKGWKSYHPRTGDDKVPANFFPWWVGSGDLAEERGASEIEAKISLEQIQEPALVSAIEKTQSQHPFYFEFSLFRLPIEIQSVYRILLLVPLGALLVVILRNIVGIKTFGTFMPVLIALAFRETQLLWGCFLFTTLLAAGLSVRFYFERLKLLLVPRLSAVLTVVVLLMAFFSILTNKLGIERGLSVALFPMVIVTMTIERMSIVWDELGPFEAIQQGIGTLFVAAVIFLIIFVPSLEHLLFVFPELLLLILASNLLLGRYTGYRVLELFRFREFRRKGQS